MEAREIGCERGVDGAEGFGAPVGIGDDCGEQVGGGDGAEKLRDDSRGGFVWCSRRRVTQKPMVTAGLRCPPEMWPTAVTMTADGEAVGEGEA